ncbi:MAG: hypothetical protein JWN27_1773, partial [Candidatus Eremiobacteraeota bacterium]|nr:hypothetical protein [Candidatus Eremiobacteraeota bacterium]
ERPAKLVEHRGRRELVGDSAQSTVPFTAARREGIARDLQIPIDQVLFDVARKAGTDAEENVILAQAKFRFDADEREFAIQPAVRRVRKRGTSVRGRPSRQAALRHVCPCAFRLYRGTADRGKLSRMTHEKVFVASIAATPAGVSSSGKSQRLGGALQGVRRNSRHRSLPHGLGFDGGLTRASTFEAVCVPMGAGRRPRDGALGLRVRALARG